MGWSPGLRIYIRQSDRHLSKCSRLNFCSGLGTKCLGTTLSLSLSLSLSVSVCLSQTLSNHSLSVQRSRTGVPSGWTRRRKARGVFSRLEWREETVRWFGFGFERGRIITTGGDRRRGARVRCPRSKQGVGERRCEGRGRRQRWKTNADRTRTTRKTT